MDGGREESANRGRKPMSKGMVSLTAAALVAASLASNVASATPVADALAIKNSAMTVKLADIEAVRWGWGWGAGAGFLGGALLGGALAAPYYRPYYYGYPPAYYYGAAPYYGPAPYYPAPGYAPAPVYAEPPDGGSVGYCMRRYRSYDPASGTFLGNDGYRHPCP
jgi:BA14K-like protein